MPDATVSAQPFMDALVSRSPAPDRAEAMKLYAWLVGHWEMDVLIYPIDGGKQSARGFVSAAWVLQGRAIQDVFAVPDLFYGTTLRIYDPAIDAWRISWLDPLNQVFCNQIGRAAGDEIVQEGREPPSLSRLFGAPTGSGSAAILRWIFSDITTASFRWRSERSFDRASWQLQREYFARRVA